MRLKFGPPSGGKGWPQFDKDGKVIKEPAKPKRTRKEPSK